MEKPQRVIKRYSNRKLYDTKDSRYVTLQQIGEMVRAGEEVQIIDNKTKEDKTEATLALILSEDLKNQPRSVPLGTLRTLIQERGERLLSSLREGPIGRLIPGGEGDDDREEGGRAEAGGLVGDETPSVPAGESGGEGEARSSASRLTQLLENSRQTVDQWQEAVEDRVLHIVPLVGQVRDLQGEVVRLTQRVAVLEEALEKAVVEAPAAMKGAKKLAGSQGSEGRHPND